MGTCGIIYIGFSFIPNSNTVVIKKFLPYLQKIVVLANICVHSYNTIYPKNEMECILCLEIRKPRKKY
jgi:hypothetical protein